jgi:hypothetical protein
MLRWISFFNDADRQAISSVFPFDVFHGLLRRDFSEWLPVRKVARLDPNKALRS